MHRLLALPLLITVSMGAKLPGDVPIPTEAPRHTQTLGDNIPASGTRQTPAPPAITAPKADETALAHCEAELRKLGSAFEREEPVRGEDGCGIDAPYRVDQIVPGVYLFPASQLRCATALALARWTGTVVVPLTEALPGDVTLTRINHGSTYICRRRNNAASGKMSEHAIGNAIDVTGFEFSGRDPIAVSPRTGDGTVEEAFQRAVRGAACLHFTTVIGPGANASHANHLHLDIIKRKRGYRMCE
ncbi:extensin family protein [Hoeflea sp.]|uniref:extensin-like domain-containing protein n=1 Tax=Hoeflea sp. TaxID=1940281 RepID=UPI003A94D1BB